MSSDKPKKNWFRRVNVRADKRKMRKNIGMHKAKMGDEVAMYNMREGRCLVRLSELGKFGITVAINGRDFKAYDIDMIAEMFRTSVNTVRGWKKLGWLRPPFLSRGLKDYWLQGQVRVFIRVMNDLADQGVIILNRKTLADHYQMMKDGDAYALYLATRITYEDVASEYDRHNVMWE